MNSQETLSDNRSAAFNETKIKVKFIFCELINCILLNGSTS